MFLLINQFRKNDFFYLGFAAVHQPYPTHLVVCFKLFSDALLCRHLLYKLKKHIFRLLIDISQVAIQHSAE